MAKSGRKGLGGALALALGMAAPAAAAAQDLDPRVAGPLMQLIQTAGMQCQAGSPPACALVPQLQQAGQELTQAQWACRQGNPQACQMFEIGAQRVMANWQQVFGGQAPTPGYPLPQPSYSPQQQAWDHQQRMQQQQMMFQQQQQQYRQQQRQSDIQHQRFMEQLRR